MTPKKNDLEQLYRLGFGDGLEKTASVDDGVEKKAGKIGDLLRKLRPWKARDAEIYFQRAQKLGKKVGFSDLPTGKKATGLGAILAAAAAGRMSKKGKGEGQ